MLAALLLLLVLGLEASGGRGAGVGADAAGNTPRALNVIIITIDTLRANHLSYFGYQKDTSPVTAEMASRAVTFREAAELGIDDLEHGFLACTDFVPDKRENECPPGNARNASLMEVDANGTEFQDLVRHLIEHDVAITSTLPVFETYTPGRPPAPSGALDSFSLRIGNLLVGNREVDACLEITLFGLKLKALTDAVITITGADMQPHLNPL